MSIELTDSLKNLLKETVLQLKGAASSLSENTMPINLNLVVIHGTSVHLKGIGINNHIWHCFKSTPLGYQKFNSLNFNCTGR